MRDRDQDRSQDPATARHDERAATGSPVDAALDAALVGLPRELAPPAALEQRVVDGLRQHGLLRRERGRAGGPLRPFARWVPAAAAAVALATSGYALGHHQGSAQTAAALLAAQKQNAEAAVRQAGAAYVAALTSLAERRAQGGQDVAAGVEAAARVAFVAAADQMVRLFPDDPLAVGILRAVESSAPGGAVAQPGDSTAARHVVWF
jgi:hypothetical protein